MCRGGPGGGRKALLPPPFLVDQLTLSQPGKADYAQHITSLPFPLRFSDLPTTLHLIFNSHNSYQFWQFDDVRKLE